MVGRQIRLVSEVRLETQVRDAVPNLGDETIAGGEAYVVAAPPFAVVDSEVVICLARVA